MKTTACFLWWGLLAATTSLPAQVMELSGMGGARYVLPVVSLKEAKFKATVKQQYDFSCGSAALATLLTQHYHFPVSEQTVFEAMFSSGDPVKIRKDGFSLLDMKKYLNAHQFQADGFELPLAKLQESALPAIVLISENGYHHFVVIKGLRNGRILVGDPSSGTRSMSQARFEAVWANKLLFVIHDKQEQARFNLDADWQVSPPAPLSVGVNFDSLGSPSLSKLGPGDF